MALQDEITRIKQAKADIKASIEAKGGSVGNGLIDTYASAIDNLPSGGGDVSEYFVKKVSGTTLKATTILKKVPMIDTTGATNANSAFNGYNELEEFAFSDFSKITDAGSMCYNCKKLKSFNYLDVSNITTAMQMFYYCTSLTKAQSFNTIKATTLRNMFAECSSLIELGELRGDACVNVANVVSNCKNLEIFGGVKNIGMAYLTTQSANNSNYTLSLSSSTKLIHDSLMDVINGLYDIASLGVQTQKLVLGSTNLSKISSDEVALATAKGWTVS